MTKFTKLLTHTLEYATISILQQFRRSVLSRRNVMPQEPKDIYENENLVLSVRGSTTLYVTAKSGDAMIAIEVTGRTIRVHDVDGDVIFTPRSKVKK